MTLFCVAVGTCGFVFIFSKMLDGVGTTCNLTPIDWLQREWVTKNRACNGRLFFFWLCRVTLVERGSPNSLCLLESGKVWTGKGFWDFVLMDESGQFTKEVTDFMTVMDELSFYLNRFCPVLKLLSPIQKQKGCAQTRISERYVEVFINLFWLNSRPCISWRDWELLCHWMGLLQLDSLETPDEWSVER